MTERNVDATRAGQTIEEAQPSVRAVVHAPMSADEALAYADSIEWRYFKPKGERAVLALAEEVRLLRTVLYAVLEEKITERLADVIGG